MNNFRTHKKVLLQDIGKDEKWLQNQIAESPSILGLGDLTLSHKELKQSSGGRLDMILTDPDNETMYEVEIMLGATDPSHIIRTIEYWDIESRRYPNREHRAVIVAEEITNRFFNVIWLLNRSIPIIAIQLNVLTIEDDFVLHFTKVLDIYETPETAEDQTAVLKNRQYWEKESSPEAMALFDEFIKLLADHSVTPQLNYRQDGIALAGKWNFARIIPRKQGYCLFKVYSRLPQDVLIKSRASLEKAGVVVKEMTQDRFSVLIDAQSLKLGAEALVELVRRGVDLDS